MTALMHAAYHSELGLRAPCLQCCCESSIRTSEGLQILDRSHQALFGWPSHTNALPSGTPAMPKISQSIDSRSGLAFGTL